MDGEDCGGGGGRQAQQRGTGWLAGCLCLPLPLTEGRERQDRKEDEQARPKRRRRGRRHLSDSESAQLSSPWHGTARCGQQNLTHQGNGKRDGKMQLLPPSTSISTKKEATEFITSAVLLALKPAAAVLL